MVAWYFRFACELSIDFIVADIQVGRRPSALWGGTCRHHPLHDRNGNVPELRRRSGNATRRGARERAFTTPARQRGASEEDTWLRPEDIALGVWQSKFRWVLGMKIIDAICWLHNHHNFVPTDGASHSDRKSADSHRPAADSHHDVTVAHSTGKSVILFLQTLKFTETKFAVIYKI